MKNTLVTLLLFVAISHTLAGAFRISHFPAVFNFGDANSDTGELSSGLGFILPPSYGQTFFKPPSSGRFCNGRLIIDFLMEEIGRPYLRSYLDSVSRESYRRGCNFAAAASTLQKANAATVSPFGFDVQVSQFITFKSKVLQLIQQDKKLKRDLPSENYFKNGLYMIDIGQKDIFGALYTMKLDQVSSLIPTILNIYQDGIKSLYVQGARNFWIHNMGPIGCYAAFVSAFGTDKSKLDEFGCVIDHNKAAKLFNWQLHCLLKKLPQQYPGSRFTYVDIFSIKSDLNVNYSKYGFDHPIMVCCGTGGPPLNYDNNATCGPTPISDGRIARPCKDSSKYVNWDGLHYTEAANRFVAQTILTGHFSETISS